MKYDTIIVGAGSAGSIIATRLTEDPNHSVLLLEAGDDYSDIGALPEEVKFGYKTSNEIWTSEHNWQYTARGTKDATIDIPRGKITGGSSAINGQVFLRAIPEDFDNWVAWGNDKWGFQDILPYYNKLETDMTYQENPGDFHGSEGPIICHRFPEEEWLPGSKAFVEACLKSGYPYCEDANLPDTDGVGPIPLNNPDGIRWSTAIGYLGISRSRLNLTIRANVEVKKILFNTARTKPQAYGVEVESKGENFVVEGKNIILSAGAIGSPQILLLSGIGPKSHLTEHGLECILDAPGVGQNLRDHPLLPLKWATKPNVDLDPFGPSGQILLRYTANGSSLKNDMIVYFGAVTSKRRDQGGTKSEPIGIGAGLGLNLALSKGELKLATTDHTDQPHLDFNLLDDPEDMRRYREGVRMLVSLENHHSMRELVDYRLEPTDEDLATDEKLEEWIRKNVGTGHHVSCTAKMGPTSDPMSVVDQHGKVHGIENLRVADASIMPDCVRANTNVTVMAIGEKVSDFIKNGF